jgi:hypothetical protein
MWIRNLHNWRWWWWWWCRRKWGQDVIDAESSRLGIIFLNCWLSGFLEYQLPDKRNTARVLSVSYAHILPFLSLSNY